MMLPSSLTQITHQHDTTSFQLSSSNTIVSPLEAESMIASIIRFPIEEIGSSAFLKLYGFQIEKLSLQAHASASKAIFSQLSRIEYDTSGVDGEDEYVIDLLLMHDKVTVLVQTLLAVEAWRLFVLGSKEKSENYDDSVKNVEFTNGASFIGQLAKQGNSLRVAFTLHVETTIVSLLALLFYRKENVVDIDNAVLISIVDYCARQMSSLAAPLQNNEMVHLQKNSPSLEQLVSNARCNMQSPVEEMKHNLLQTEFKTAVKSISVARYLCEHFESLSISVQSRILNTHDFLMLFIPLIDEPPWTRRRNPQIQRKPNSVDEPRNEERAVWEKYIDQEWTVVEPCDLMQITNCEAQCWVALFHLVCGNESCRERYGLNSYRKEQILRLRKFLNEYMVDQLPVLVDVARYMDELSLMNVPDHSSTTGTGMNVLLDQIDLHRESTLKKSQHEWDNVIQSQLKSIFSGVTDSTDEDLRLIATIFDEDDFIHALSNNADKTQGTPLKDKAGEISHVHICARKDGDKETDSSLHELFKLTPNEDFEGITIQTPNGPFRRTMLNIEQLGYVDKFFQSKSLIVYAKLFFEEVHLVKQYSSELGIEIESKKQFEWIQLGKIEDDLVIQLGFKRQGDDLNNLLNLDQAFLAKPCKLLP